MRSLMMLGPVFTLFFFFILVNQLVLKFTRDSSGKMIGNVTAR